MNDQVYVRFFNMRQDEIPVDSHKVTALTSDFLSAIIAAVANDGQIADWLRAHPNGKVDFVVL